MSDDSDESGSSIPLDKPSSRDKKARDKQYDSDDELSKLTARNFRDKINSESGSSLTSSAREGREFTTSSVREGREFTTSSVREGREVTAFTGNQKNPLSQSMVESRPIGPYCKMKSWNSVDSSGDSEMLEVTRRNLPLAGSIKRKLRRKPTKRFDKIDEAYGLNTEEYDQIRSRVLQERAVVNAIEALQERWRMIMYMYHDCVDLNEGRKDRDQKRLTVKRQLELMVIVTVFVVMCIPITVMMVKLCR